MPARRTRTQIDSWLTINADNTATLSHGKVELGQGSTTGLLHDRRRGARHGHSPDRRRSRHDTNVDRRTGRRPAARASIAIGGPQAARPRRRRAAGAARPRVDEARRPGREPDGRARASSRAAASPSPTATLIGGKLFNVHDRRDGVSPASRRRSRQPVQARRHASPRVDIPDKVTGKYTYIHNIRVPGMLHGRVVRPRGQGAYGVRHRREAAVGRRELDQAHPGRAGRARRRLPRRRRPHEYDAIQAAAQLKVKWARPADAAGQRQPLRADARLDTAGQAPTASGRTPATSTRRCVGRAKTVAATYKYHYNGHVPIGPNVRGRRRDGRRARSCSRTRRTPTALRTERSRRRSELPRERSASQYYEGSSVYGNAPTYDDVAHRGGDHVAVGRQAGAPAVHALGRARLGQLRPGRSSPTSAAASTRTARSSRYDYTALSASPYYSIDPPRELAGDGDPLRRRAPAAPTPTNVGHAVRHPEPARDRQDRCRC